MFKNTGRSKSIRAFDYLHEHIIAVIIIVVILAGSLSTLYILNDKNETRSEGKEDGVEYVDSDTISFSMERTETLDPLVSGSEDVYYIAQLIYSSLFILDENLTPVPDLVASYTTDASEGTVSVTLRSDAKFSDGSPVTAYDVRSTVNLIKGEGAKSPYYNYVSKISYIGVNGDYSLDVVFAKKEEAAIDNLVFPIVSSADYQRGKNNIMGSGIYKYAEYDFRKELKLVPNEYYYGPKAENKVEVKVLPDKKTTVNLMETDSVTAYFMHQNEADIVADDHHLRETPVVSSEAEYLGFNFRKPELANKDFRQAVCSAINTDTIIRDNYGGSAVASDTIFYPGFLGTENSGDAYPFNHDQAVKSLKKAGYEDRDENGIAEDSKGKEASLVILVNNNDKRRTLSAKSISKNLKNVGIKAEVEAVSWEEYNNRLKKGDYDLYLGGFKFDKQYNLKKLFEKDNLLGYNNKEVASEIAKLETALTAEEQKTVFQGVKQKLTEEVPYYCLCYKTYAFLTVERFTGNTVPTFFDRFRGCQDWKCQKAVVTEKPEESDSEER